jgi:dihydropteroate synthase
MAGTPVRPVTVVNPLPDRHKVTIMRTDVAAGPPGLPRAGRCLVMGVVNVTPDSFSDGGAWFGVDAAIARGVELAGQGADIVDVGGESTRPGAQRIPAEEELRRVLPVIKGLADAGIPVSVDTMRAEVAEAALTAGARLVNDVSGGLADPQMGRLVAGAGVPYVVMHWRGHSHRMQERAIYADVVGEVRLELRRRVDVLVSDGVDPGLIVLDPGLGFAKHPEHNWKLLTHLADLARLSEGGPTFPVLIGASRKRFLGRLLADPAGTPRPFGECDDATVAVTALAAAAGAWCVRVHEVPANADAVAVARAWREIGGTAEAPASGGGPPAEVPASEGGPGADDRICLSGLRVFARHGVLEHESRDGQEFVIDAALTLDIRPAAAADALPRTVDYSAVADKIVREASGPPVKLIETLAERLAQVCLTEPGVRGAEITVHKPHAPLPHRFTDVTVTVRRARR